VISRLLRVDVVELGLSAPRPRRLMLAGRGLSMNLLNVAALYEIASCVDSHC
jgi:hypothetical protein